MRSLFKKISLVIVPVLFLSCSSLNYGEEADQQKQLTPSHIEVETEDLLFKFIRDNLFLSFLEFGENKWSTLEKLSLDSIYQAYEDSIVLKELPFRDLHHKLVMKLINLANDEKTTSQCKSDEMEKPLSDCINTLNHITLNQALNFDISAITKSQEGLAPDEKKELLALIFESEMTNYKEFAEQNRDILEKIKKIANDDEFVVLIDEPEFVGEKKCRIYKEKEFCIDSKTSKREIKSLSELLTYLLKQDESKAVKDQQLTVDTKASSITTGLHKESASKADNLELFATSEATFAKQKEEPINELPNPDPEHQDFAPAESLVVNKPASTDLKPLANSDETSSDEQPLVDPVTEGNLQPINSESVNTPASAPEEVSDLKEVAKN